MAVYKIFPIKDATLYSEYDFMNTGLDEITQISNLNSAISTSPSVARILTQFDTDEISDVLNTTVTGTWDAYFRTYIATAQGLTEAIDLNIFPISESWNNGTGKYLDYPINGDGTSWQYIDFNGGTQWGNGDPLNGTPHLRSTASYNNNYAIAGGGTWYLTSSFGSVAYPYTQSMGARTDKDLNVKVTETVHDWHSGSIVNNGFIAKLEESAEFITSKLIQPVLQYYSLDTNTIYPPQLEIKWNDYVYNPSPLIETLSGSDLFVSLAENSGEYLEESVNRFRVNVREEYPKRVFTTSSVYLTQHYLPTSSYYAIKDLDTNEYVVDFDTTYTQISADEESSYFDVHMAGLQPERYYKILIKVDNGKSIKIHDRDYYFKIRAKA